MCWIVWNNSLSYFNSSVFCFSLSLRIMWTSCCVFKSITACKIFESVTWELLHISDKSNRNSPTWEEIFQLPYSTIICYFYISWEIISCDNILVSGNICTNSLPWILEVVLLLIFPFYWIVYVTKQAFSFFFFFLGTLLQLLIYTDSLVLFLSICFVQVTIMKMSLISLV